MQEEISLLAMQLLAETAPVSGLALSLEENRHLQGNDGGAAALWPTKPSLIEDPGTTP